MEMVGVKLMTRVATAWRTHSVASSNVGGKDLPVSPENVGGGDVGFGCERCQGAAGFLRFIEIKRGAAVYSDDLGEGGHILQQLLAKRQDVVNHEGAARQYQRYACYPHDNQGLL